MKIRRVVPIALAATTALAISSAPSKAVQTYNIRTTKTFFSAADGWKAAGCPGAFLTSPANGSDSVVIDIGARANQQVPVTWSATVARPELGGGMQAIFVTAGCSQMSTGSSGSGTNPGVWTLNVPAGARYLVITNMFLTNVTLAL
jgi:hypothetical protein